MDIITRKEAQRQGLLYYFTGTPCKRGGVAKRVVSGHKCTCERCCNARNEQKRGKYAEDPQKQINKFKEWMRENPEKRLEQRRREYVRIKARRETDKDFRERTDEINRRSCLSMYHRRYGTDSEFTLKAKANAAHQKVKRRRLMGLVQLTPAEELQVKAIYRLRYTLTRETGIEYHVDHRIPLKHGGKHHPNNLWVITAEENLRKGAKLLP